MSATPDSGLQLYRRLLTHVTPYKWAFACALVGMLVVAAGDTAIAAMLRPIVDKGLVARDASFIHWAPLLLLLIAVVRALGNFVDNYSMNWVARCVVRDLRQRMFESLLRAPAHYYDQRPSGMLVSRLTNDVEQIAQASSGVFRVLFRDGFKALFLLVWMLFMSWKLSLLFLGIVPLAFLIFKASGHRFRTISKRIQESVGVINHTAREIIQGQRAVKIFAAYDYARGAFLAANNHHRQQSMKRTAISAASVPLMVLLSGIGMAAVIWMALRLDLSPGMFTSYIGSMIMLSRPISNLANVNLSIQQGLAGAQSVFSTMDVEQEYDRGCVHLSAIRGDVAFRNVSFHYAAGDRPTLHDISFTMAAGTTVALVGASGSGKSTIAALLARFYPPKSGHIHIDDAPLNSFTLASLRAHIAIVPQEVILFDDTIRNNIAYGAAEQADPQRLAAAADAAHVTEFARNMPHGLNTWVGEQGIRLSGGQRQRIAIARALYKDAPLLILDEATSSLDSHSERHIQAAIAHLVKNRTTLVIAHRLSTIESADQILVLEGGRIVERGRHQELLHHGGVYAHLHRAQYDQNHAVWPAE